MVTRPGRPEKLLYVDTGCSVAPKCVQCPLPVCKYDEPPSIARRTVRDQQIRDARGHGWSVAELTKQYSLSKRSLYRILAGG